MKTVACILKCKCGGHAQVLPEDGVYYILTHKHTIILQGYCLKCQEPVKLEQSLYDLLLHCPSIGKAH